MYSPCFTIPVRPKSHHYICIYFAISCTSHTHINTSINFHLDGRTRVTCEQMHASHYHYYLLFYAESSVRITYIMCVRRAVQFIGGITHELNVGARLKYELLLCSELCNIIWWLFINSCWCGYGTVAGQPEIDAWPINFWWTISLRYIYYKGMLMLTQYIHTRRGAFNAHTSGMSTYIWLATADLAFLILFFANARPHAQHYKLDSVAWTLPQFTAGQTSHHFDSNCKWAFSLSLFLPVSPHALHTYIRLAQLNGTCLLLWNIPTWGIWMELLLVHTVNECFCVVHALRLCDLWGWPPAASLASAPPIVMWYMLACMRRTCEFP